MVRRTALCLSLLTVAACEPEDVGLRWELNLDPAAEARAVRVQAWIARGSCAAPGEVVHRVELRAGGSVGAGPVLEPGAYAFGARAADADCLWFADGCVDAQLPQDDGASVVVPVGDSGSAEDACGGMACVGGACVADGGASDAGGDAGVDGGGDAGVDAGSEGPCGDVHADDDTMPICRASGSVVVDGVLEEYAEAFPVTVTAGAATGTFRALWDCEHLYIAASMADGQVFATYDERDSGDLWRTDSIEVMLDTAHDGTTSDTDENDYHLLAGATGTVRDAQGGAFPYDASYDMAELRVEAAVDGIVDDLEADTGWTVELAIAWSDFGVTACPEAGTILGANLALNDETRSGGEVMHDPGDWAGLSIYANPAAWNDLLLLDAEGRL